MGLAWHYGLVSTDRPGSTYRWRKLRAYVLTRDKLTCQRCTTPHQLTTHDKSLATHATLGHKDGKDWHLTRTTSWDPDDYQAECSRANYSDGATKGNQLRVAPMPADDVGASRRW